MRYRLVAVAAALLLGVATWVHASEQETVTLRGKTFQVWPVEDLVERGFEEMTPIPKEDNAAWVYIDAVNAYEDLPPKLEDAFNHAVDVAWPEGQEKLAEYIQSPANQRAMELVVQASKVKRFRMPYFGDPQTSVLQILLPNLSYLRSLSKMMVVDGRRLEAEGKYDDAIARYLTVMRMGQHVNADFTLIGNLVGFAIWALGEKAVTDLALRRPLSREQLSKLQSELEKLGEQLPTIDRGLHGEQVFGPAIVDELCSRLLTLPMNLRTMGSGDEFFSYASGPLNANPADGWGELELRVGRLIYPDRAIKRHMLGYYEKVLEKAERGPRNAAAMEFDEERYIKEEIPKWDILPRVLLPSLSRAISLGERVKAQAALTRAVVAIRLYMLKHEGQPPPSLSDVAETLPEGRLIDPFSGELLVYRVTDDGWIVYSFGPDLVDDGGQQEERWDKLDRAYKYPAEPAKTFEQEGGE